MFPRDNGMTITLFEDIGASGRYVWLNNYIPRNIVGCIYLAMMLIYGPWQQSSAEIHRLHLGKSQLNQYFKWVARYKRTTGTLGHLFNLGHRYSNKYMQLTHTIKINHITTLAKRWPNVVDDSVGPTLAGRWPNVDTSPLGQRKGSWPKQRWANGWCQRWPNQCASVGPMLAQPNIAIWDPSIHFHCYYKFLRQSKESLSSSSSLSTSPLSLIVVIILVVIIIITVSSSSLWSSLEREDKHNPFFIYR